VSSSEPTVIGSTLLIELLERQFRIPSLPGRHAPILAHMMTAAIHADRVIPALSVVHHPATRPLTEVTAEMSSPIAEDRFISSARASPGTLYLPVNVQVHRDRGQPSRSFDLLRCSIEAVEEGVQDLAAARTVKVSPWDEPVPDKFIYPDTRLFPPL